MRVVKIILAGIGAVVMAAGLGSVIQTQFNLAAIERLGAPVSAAQRLEATLHDLANFGPTYAVPVALAFVVALPLAAGLNRLLPGNPRAATYALAGALAVLALVVVIDAALPATIIAATRSALGKLLMTLAGAAGGWTFARLICRPSG